MRKLTDAEQEKIKLLTKNQVSITLIEPTETGLKKSIMDATGSVRSYLKSENIHDYELQQQGTESKVMTPAIIHTGFKTINSQASLYRPSTKKGDPRIWFYSLTKVADPNDIIAITFYNDSFQVFNLTKLDISRPRKIKNKVERLLLIQLDAYHLMNLHFFGFLIFLLVF